MTEEKEMTEERRKTRKLNAKKGNKMKEEYRRNQRGKGKAIRAGGKEYEKEMKDR